MPDNCNHCGRDPHGVPDGKPHFDFHGMLEAIYLRRKVDGTPPLHIYDVLWQITGTEGAIVTTLKRGGRSSLEEKLGQTFPVKGTMEHDVIGPPPLSVQRTIAALRSKMDVTLTVGQIRVLLEWINALTLAAATPHWALQADVDSAKGRP